MKALTIMSQRRYVKFFVGFLHKLAAEQGKKEETFFELSLRQNNHLSFNRVFEDMRQQTLDFYSICLGPFPAEVKGFDVLISTLHKDEIKLMTSYKKWEENHANTISEEELKQIKYWIQI